ncbi:rod shape-determining protein RodA [uncultured Sphingomonas sp.]|uniref:rod shape-determining protein RodA n=1 Tax=uncultured Sphingomonas sp. TaxID=158754 RepID=UPI0035CC1E11
MRSDALPAPLRALPWRMLLAMLGATAFGLLTLYSAAGGRVMPWAGNQGIRFVVLFVVMLALSYVRVETWRRIAYPAYAIAFLMLIVVEAMGHIGMGAQRWIDLGIIRVQPSEFMKLAVVLSLARFFNGVPPRFIGQPSVLLVPVLLIGAPVGLVMLQPDLGTALMISFAGVAIMFLAGIQLRWFLGGAALLAAMAPIAWGMLHDYQRNRVFTFMDPESDPLGTGYHITQSKIAIGSSGLWGKGYLGGSQSHLDYLPEKQTDFIFATMMEEWGLLGGLTVLVLYGYIIWWGFQLAQASRTVFTRLTAMGLSFTLFLYVGINLAMVTGLAPVVGIPLPLFSYGGSAMMTVLILFGILISIHREEQRSR